MGGQHHAVVALPPAINRCPLYRKLGGPQGRRSERIGGKKSAPTGIRSPDRPVRSESLYRISYPGPTDICTGPNHVNNTSERTSGVLPSFCISHFKHLTSFCATWRVLITRVLFPCATRYGFTLFWISLHPDHCHLSRKMGLTCLWFLCFLQRLPRSGNKQHSTNVTGTLH